MPPSADVTLSSSSFYFCLVSFPHQNDSKCHCLRTFGLLFLPSFLPPLPNHPTSLSALLLQDLSTALLASPLIHWLDVGALLGIHRDGELILRDNDIDFVVINTGGWEYLAAHLTRHLPNGKYRIEAITRPAPFESVWTRVCCPFAMAYVVSGTILYDVNRNKQIIRVDHGHKKKKNRRVRQLEDVDRNCVLPVRLIEWEGIRISVPNNIEAVLQKRYGRNWRIPRYMDNGADTVEGNKPYAKVLRALSCIGIKF